MSKSNVMLGFGKALTGVIIASVATSVCFASLTVAILNSSTRQSHLISSIFWFVVAFFLCIIPLCMGISSISTYKTCYSKKGKPVPALVLGIISVVTSGINALLLLSNLFVLFADFYTRLI